MGATADGAALVAGELAGGSAIVDGALVVSPGDPVAGVVDGAPVVVTPGPGRVVGAAPGEVVEVLVVVSATAVVVVVVVVV